MFDLCVYPLLALILLQQPQDSKEEPRLNTTDPVVCVQVTGFRDYVEREKVELTPDDKLVVYCEPFNYRIRRDPDTNEYHAHLVQDAIIRRKGQTAPLRIEKKVLEYQPRSETPPMPLYLATTIGLKGMAVGEYELEVLLSDRHEPKDASRRQVIRFRVIEGP